MEGTVRELKVCFKKAIDNPSIIQQMNSYIVDRFDIKTMSEHVHEIELLYQK